MLLVTGCGDDAAPADAALVCATDEQCTDGVFCNGVESCDPSNALSNALGCLAGVPPCMPGQRCDEEPDTCETLCDVTTDADGDGDTAVGCGGTDCDDSDPGRFLGNAEVCDDAGVDEDCDPDTYGSRDIDGDGHEDAACCNGDRCGTDCEDRMATVNPGAAEVCDLIDQDCDGSVDEGVQTNGFEDLDGDRYGDPDRARMACAFDGDVSPSMDDCDDDDGRRHGQMLEICDEVDNDCDGATDEERFSVSWYADTDGDGFGDPSGEVRASCEPIEGFSTLPFDCDDSDAGRSPITPEECNALDDDCDGRADFVLETGDTEDDDGDGVADARCPGGLGMDCDDRDPFARPDHPELCDGVDNDCDGTVDEGATEQLWYVDGDGDGFGDESAERRASCERVPGLVLEGGDCDDGDRDRRPGAPERCNGLDDDCDGSVDEDAGFVATYADADGDGFGSGMPMAQCAVAGLRTLTPGDCDDGDPGNRPGAAERCDGVDNDCDGTSDEGATAVAWYADGDGDGYGDLGASPVMSCEPVAGASVVATDCADDDAGRFPGAPELCDTVDQDCDGSVDEDTSEVLQYPDGDGDGFGTGAGTASCAPLGGHVLRGGDCADGDGASFPGADERCNAADDDCDGVTDEAPAGYLDCGVDATNATPVCTAGACGYGECLSGYDDCDGVPANGCESDLAADQRNCGACGASCGPGGVCSGSTCTDVPVTSVATSIGVGCAVRGGQVFCWGSEGSLGTQGGLGDGEVRTATAYAPDPTRAVLGLNDVTQVVAGHAHFCALRSTGEVRCWGANSNNQLGDGTGTLAYEPVAVAGGHVFEQIDASTSHTCGRTTSDELYCWGYHIGRASPTPTLVPRAAGTPAGITDLAVGREHACIVAGDGYIYCYGYEAVVVGRGSGLDFEELVGPVVDETAMPVTGVVDLAASYRNTCAALDTGEVVCWGYNNGGQLGDGTIGNEFHRANAAPVSGIADAVGVFVGTSMACAVRATGAVMCWGSNAATALGDPAFTDAESTTPRALPGVLDATSGSQFVNATGFSSPVCVTEGGGVMCWANGSRGGCGDGSTADGIRAPAVRVVGFP